MIVFDDGLRDVRKLFSEDGARSVKEISKDENGKSNLKRIVYLYSEESLKTYIFNNWK